MGIVRSNCPDMYRQTLMDENCTVAKNALTSPNNVPQIEQDGGLFSLSMTGSRVDQQRRTDF